MKRDGFSETFLLGVRRWRWRSSAASSPASPQGFEREHEWAAGAEQAGPEGDGLPHRRANSALVQRLMPNGAMNP